MQTDELNMYFNNMMVLGSVGRVITEWKDIPMELLMRIVSLLDDRTVIVASGVCSGWRDAICWGLTQFSLSWYLLSFRFTLCFYAYVFRLIFGDSA